MIRIVVIDSGINKNHPLLKDYTNIKGIGVKLDDDGNLIIDNHYNDEIGHGTGIAYILCKYIANLELIMIKAFDTTEDVEEKKIIKVLEYIDNSFEKIDIVSLSFGITLCDEKEQLRQICEKLHKKKIVVVAAYDNFGKMMYPACFDTVIGVDIDPGVKKVFDYIFVKNSEINIRANSVKHRLPGKGDEMIDVYGTSFAVPYLDVVIANIIKKKGNSDSLQDELESNAIKVICKQSNTYCNPQIQIASAIVFPYQKETINIVRYSKFEVCGIYDVRGSGNIGKKIEAYGKESKFVVEDINKVDWNNKFDSIVIGYCISKNISQDWINEILKKCKLFGKKVYVFTNEKLIETEHGKLTDLEVYQICPEIDRFYDTKFGKMWDVSKPVVCVAGTSSIQGKFTTQVILREELSQRGYKVGHLGTEPHSFLMGCDECFPYGYGSSVFMSPVEKILYVNQLMHKVESKNPDIIISGLQSNLWQYGDGNVLFYPTDQYEVLIGINPDAVILCINLNDDFEYIQKNITYIEMIWEIKCIVLVLFPYNKNYTMQSAFEFEFARVQQKEAYNRIVEIENRFKKQVLSINDERFSEKIADSVINFF